MQGASSYEPGCRQATCNEFGSMTYKRVFTLSDMVDRESIRAVIRDGMLDLFLPEAESMKSRRIEIKAESL